MSSGSIGNPWLEALDAAIDARVSDAPGRALMAATAALTMRYRGEDVQTPAAEGRAPRAAVSREPRPHAHGMHRGRGAAVGTASAGLTDVERLAYLVVRAPATGAAVRTVLADMQARGVGVGANAGAGAATTGESRESGDASDGVIRTMLDLGAGPGVGMWAALDRLDTLEAATLVERDAGSVVLGEALAREASLDQRLALTWRRADLRDPLDLAPHDLVLLSYSIGELDEAAALALLERAWRLARVALVVIEPGTPRHAARLLTLRQRLIDSGARIAAPCPHARACPMAPNASAHGPDWCHFAARLGRTRLHRQLKQGALSYEDEKYSYLVAARPEAARAAAPAAARIVRRPEYHKGFVRLQICATDGLRVDTVTKSQREHYRAARDAAWGDAWQPAGPRATRESDAAMDSAAMDSTAIDGTAIDGGAMQGEEDACPRPDEA